MITVRSLRGVARRVPYTEILLVITVARGRGVSPARRYTGIFTQ